MFIQVVQDIACPWCRIGEHNLKTALRQWSDRGGEPIEVQWFPYLLDPVEPGTRENFRQRFIDRKGMAPEQMDTMFDRVVSAGAQQGITFHFDKIEFAYSTVLAHQLIALAPADKQTAVVEALHDAYFEEGADIESVDVLIGIAGKAGVEESYLPELRAGLEQEVRKADVVAMIDQARAAGITGVPFFIFDGKLSLSGAQPPQTMLAAIEQAALQVGSPAAG